jgi:hypothetical protein
MLGVDIGNVIFLEHVNLTFPDKELASEFYCVCLGLTRDPYQRVGSGTMWINAGRQQIHIPVGAPSIVPGYITLVVPDLDQLLRSLQSANVKWNKQSNAVEVECPWGNRFVCVQETDWICRVPGGLGICQVGVTCPRGAMDAVDWVYEHMLGAVVVKDEEDTRRRVIVGPYQQIVFEQGDQVQEWDSSFHIAIYVGKFRDTWEKFAKAGLLWKNPRFVDECDTWEKALAGLQFRFRDFADRTGKVWFKLEHEVRSSGHGSYMRTLVNRTGKTGIYCDQ